MNRQVSVKAQGPYPDFELHTIGWKSFQHLCATIMGEVLGQTIAILSDSHDSGQDGVFLGTWKRTEQELFEGTFTIQCKFTSDATKILTLSDLEKEIPKARVLSSRGKARNYFILTNGKLTGENNKEVIEAFQAIPGIDRCVIYGREALNRFIKESPRLRRLVPRVYGLGDLSWIFDERACDQAIEILSSLGSDLNKYVITKPFKKSVKALQKHGFVLLLGEPACGKSTIAAALALGALDVEGCPTFKIRDGNELVNHSNPNEPKQFFWVDDAFGATQYNRSCIDTWNRVFPHMTAAIRRGARILFTSRDYIYNAAKRDLKESAFPVIAQSQVVIYVEKTTKKEREQILYNHIKLGNQQKDFKTRIKPFLPTIAAHKRFSPEIARRFGDSLFTKGFVISAKGCDDFVSKPKEFLREILQGLDADSLSAVALIFMRGGALPCLAEYTDLEKQAIERLGGSQHGIINSLSALKGSLLNLVIVDGINVWRFKHPTIREGFSALIAGNPELLDIYLTGTPLEIVLKEVFCAGIASSNEEVILPLDRYDELIKRIASLNSQSEENGDLLHSFLAYHADCEFLKRYIEVNPDFITGLRVGSYLDAISDIIVISRLYEFGLLPEDKRLRVVETIKELAVQTPDAGFLSKRLRGIFTDKEFQDIICFVRDNLLPNLSKAISDWSNSYSFNKDRDPETYFEPLKDTLRDYRNLFKNDSDSIDKLDDALSEIETEIESLNDMYPEISNWDDEDYSRSLATSSSTSRSIFEDVDE